MTPAFSTNEVLARLENLWRYLEDEGLYTRANTVSLAIDEIKRLTDEVATCRLNPSPDGSSKCKSGGSPALMRNAGDSSGSQPGKS